MDGKRTVRFYNDDIRALAVLAWAQTSVDAYLIGGRCESKAQDASGHELDKDCFDTNPGTLHIVAANMLGIQHRSFVLDASADLEVWNQPANGYNLKYWNPMTAQYAPLSEAIVPYADLSQFDQFRQYRHPGTVYMVGVTMDFSYIFEHQPTGYAEYRDNIVVVNYKYDLELDADKNIIGGEWYTNKHPDFLWMPTDGAKPVTAAVDSRAGDLTYDGSVGSLKRIVSTVHPQEVSYSKHTPLYSIVKGLIKLSQ